MIYGVGLWKRSEQEIVQPQLPSSHILSVQSECRNPLLNDIFVLLFFFFLFLLAFEILLCCALLFGNPHTLSEIVLVSQRLGLSSLFCQI